MIPPMTALSVEPPPAASKSYLWVADPRQVSFFYAAKRKSPKKRPPRSHRPLRGFLCCAGMHECRGRRDAQERPLLARIGARLTRRAQTTRLGLEQEASDTPDSCCDARRRLRGPKKQHPFGRCRSQMLQASRSYPYSTAKWVLFQPPSERAEHRSAPKGCRAPPVRARSAFLSARRVRRALGGASSAGDRALCARRSDRGGLSFGDFSLAVQRKATCRGSATHK